jgi:hypothetical protein
MSASSKNSCNTNTRTHGGSGCVPQQISQPQQRAHRQTCVEMLHQNTRRGQAHQYSKPRLPGQRRRLGTVEVKLGLQQIQTILKSAMIHTAPIQRHMKARRAQRYACDERVCQNTLRSQVHRHSKPQRKGHHRRFGLHHSIKVKQYSRVPVAALIIEPLDSIICGEIT